MFILDHNWPFPTCFIAWNSFEFIKWLAKIDLHFQPPFQSCLKGVETKQISLIQSVVRISKVPDQLRFNYFRLFDFDLFEGKTAHFCQLFYYLKFNYAESKNWRVHILLEVWGRNLILRKSVVNVWQGWRLIVCWGWCDILDRSLSLYFIIFSWLFSLYCDCLQQ